MPISSDPNDLMAAARCFKCIPAGMQDEVIIYLLAQIVNSELTPQQLVEAARCFKCIPKGMQQEVITFLLCQNANGQIMNSNLLASGLAQLAGGTVTVNNPNASSSNVILLSYFSLDGGSSLINYSNVVLGISFVITSQNPTDTNMVSWSILKP